MKSSAFVCIVAVGFLATGVLLHAAPAEPVWPGSNTRFYPGIYPRDGAPDRKVSEVREQLDRWWGDVDRDRYREIQNGRRLTHLGIKCAFSPWTIYSSHWYQDERGPYDYAANCANSPLIQNPDAVVDGHKVYDWTWFDEILALPLIENGECKVMFKYDDQSIRRSHPKWWVTQGMMMLNLTHPKKYDWVYARCKMDFLKAYATRYAGNPKIAGFVLEEYAECLDEGVTCGYVVPDQNWEVSAENGTFFYPAKAMLEADPGLMIIFVGPGAFGMDYFEGRGTGLGLDDLPGIQAIAVQDLRFFLRTCGTGAPGSVDATKLDWGMYWLAQQAFIRNDLAVMVHSERNGWTPRAHDRRIGSQNPWNVPVWPKNDSPWDGEKVGEGGAHMFPDPAFWVWYCSGPPKARGAAADSRLGQPGPDPAGVIPSHFYDPCVPWNIEPGGSSVDSSGRRRWLDSWNATNMSHDRFRKAFSLFGPSGTKAMFAFPKGYVESFLAQPER